MSKIQVFHFSNGSGGGVLSVIRNLLRFSNNPLIENHIIYTIHKKDAASFSIEHLDGAVSEQVFYYSPNWNFYYTCRQLAKLLPNDKALIVAHDWLELGMVSNLGLQNPVVHFLHGNYDYYYHLAKLNQQGVNHFIAVSKPIYNNLIIQLPERKEDISCRYFPVPDIKKLDKENDSFNIFYGVGSLEYTNKQFNVVAEIDSHLKLNKIPVKWTIVGKCTALATREKLAALQNHRHFEDLENKEVLELLGDQHIFILPSINEGLPVSLVEAMKAGLVPLIPSWGNALAGLVLEGNTGYYIERTDIAGYVEKIKTLKGNRSLLSEIAVNAAVKANELFDPYLNTTAIETIFIAASTSIQQKKAVKAYGSRLDHPLLPNFFTKIIRSISA